MRRGVFLLLFLFAAPALAAQDLNLKISVDKSVYEFGEVMRVSGSLLDNVTPVSSAAIVASLFSDSGTFYSLNSTSTSSNGTFFTYLSAPSSAGNYKIAVNATSTDRTTGYIGLRVDRGANFKIETSKAAYSPNENVSVLVYAQDVLGSAVSNLSINATLMNSTGGQQNFSGIQLTDSEGKASFSFLAPSSIGYYTFLVNNMFSQSIRVASFQVYAYITNSNGDPAWSFSPDENVTINAVVTDSSGNPYSADASAVVTSPPPTVTSAVSNFTNTSTGKYQGRYVAGAQEGQYSVKVTATSGSASADTYTKFLVSNLYVIVERIEGAEGSVTPGSAYYVLLTVRDGSGALKTNASVSAKFTNAMGETLANFSGVEDTTSKIYKISVRSPSDVGTFDFTITAIADGKTATWASRVQVSSVKANLNLDKFTYSPGDTVNARVDIQPAAYVSNLSYEVWGPSGIESSGSNFTQSSNGTAAFSFTAPRSSGFYKMNAKVNGVVGVQGGFEVKNYRIWIESRNGSSSASGWQQVYPSGSLVYLHVNFQDSSGKYVNLTSSVGNFSYSLARLYSHTENKDYSSNSSIANVSIVSVYEGASSTVVVLSLNSSALSSGDYGVELSIKDKSGARDTAFGGFRVGSFNIRAFASSWQYSQGDDVTVSVYVESFGGSPMQGQPVRLVSSEQADKWPPVGDTLSSGSVTNGTTDAGGLATLTLKSTWVFGFHNLRIEAVNGTLRQEAFAGFMVRGFSLSGSIDKGTSLYAGQNYTITATAQDSSGTPVSNVNVTLIEIRSAKDWNIVSTPNDNLGLTDSGGSKTKTRTVASDRSSGTYVLVLKGEKNGEVVYSNVWYEVRSFDVKFQSGKSGQYEDWYWAGMQQPGTSIDIPTKVTKGGTAVSGANLSVVKLVRTDVWPNTEVSATSNSTSTSSGGTATVSYPIPSSLASGEYALILNVSDSSSSTLTDPWRSPHVLVRTYEVFMDLQKNGMFVWGTMAGENVSVVFNVRYPQNFTGVRNVNVSLVALKNNDETLFRNLSVQAGQGYIYPNNRTGQDGTAVIPLTTPNRTGTFIIVGTVGGEEFRRWFDVSSFTPSIDMGNHYDFFLDGNLTFTAHARDGSGLDVSGVTINVSGVWNNWDWTPVDFTPQTFVTGSNGAPVTFNLTQAGITSPGDYSARVLFTSGGSTSEFWMWFRVKSFDVRLFPSKKFSYGDALNFTVQVMPKQAVSAKLVKLRSALNWNELDDYSSASYNATTDAGTGFASVIGPDNLSRGEYIAEFNVTNSPPFFAWFDVRSFDLQVWLDRWAYQTGENLSLRVCPSGNYTVSYVRYGSSTTSGSFNVSDTNCNTPKQLSGFTSPGGSYKLKLTLTGSNGQSEERWVWYEARTYDAWVWFERWQVNPGENATAHGNVRLGNRGVQNINVTLDSIGFEHEYSVNATTPYTELNLTVDLREIGWTEGSSYAIVTLTSGTSTTVQLNQSSSYSFGNHTLELFGSYYDRSSNPVARIRVDRLIRANGNRYFNSTDERGETTFQFPIPLDAKSGSHSAKFLVEGQEIIPWFEVIPFSYRAYLLQDGSQKKSLNGGKPASIMVNSSAQLNVSIVGIMRNGWEPVANITTSNESNLNIGNRLSLGNASVTLVNITCPAQQNMFEPCRANITVNSSGSLSSEEVWPWFMLTTGGVMVNVRDIFAGSAQVSITQPVNLVANSSRLANYTFNVPNQEGGYAVNLVIQDAAGVSPPMPDMLWFSIDSVNAWGWVERWQYNVGENVTLVAQVQRGPQPASGYVANVTRLRYRQDFSPDSTIINTSYNATTGSDGMARIVIPAAILSGGEYEATVEVYEPSNPSMRVQFSQWFRVRTFDVWMRDAGQWAVYLGEYMSFIVETSPPQSGANVTLSEYFFDFIPQASLELQQLNGPQHDSNMITLGNNASFSGFNVSFLSTSKVCVKGPEMDFGVASSVNLTLSNGTSSRNVTIYGMDQQTQQSAPVNISNEGGIFELRLNNVWCQPINEQFFPLATQVTDANGRATVTFNTSLLTDTNSSEHPVYVNVTKNGQTARGYGGFMLKPFDVEAWFEGKDMNPSFLSSENITVKVRVTRQGSPVFNVSIAEEGFSICPEMSSSQPSGGGSGGGGGGEGSGGSGGPGQFWCQQYFEPFTPVSTDAYGLASFQFNGRINGSRSAGNYNVGIRAADPATGKYSFTKISFTTASFTAAVSPSVTEPGSPITVTIASDMPNAVSDVSVEDRSSWNNQTNSFNFRSLAHGSVDGSGSGTLIANTTGMASGRYAMRISLVLGNTTKTSTASFEIRSYNLDVLFDKSTYLPGENMTLTLRASRGGYPLQGVTISRAEMFDTLSWNTPSQFRDNPAAPTGPDGTTILQWSAPQAPSTWALSLRSAFGADMSESWAEFRVSRYSLAVSSPARYFAGPASVTFSVNVSNSTAIPAGTSLTLALVQRYNATSKLLRSEGNLSAPFACVRNLPASRNVTFPACSLASPGLYEGVIVLNNTPITDFSNVPDALAVAGADDVLVWVGGPGVNVNYQSSVIGSTPRTERNFSINYTAPSNKYVPFTVYSLEPFPGPFYGLLKGSVEAMPVHINGSRNLSVGAPDVGGLVYAITLFTDKDVASLSEIFGGNGLTGDLTLLSDIRQNNFTITQANASVKIASPGNGSTVGPNFPVQAIQGGNMSLVRGMRGNFSGKPGAFNFMGGEFWQNVTAGTYTLSVWLVNNESVPISGPEASDTVSFTVGP